MLPATESTLSPLAVEDGQMREFLSFTLGAEEYAIDILKVKEIRGYGAVTPIGGAPDFIKGVINLRGVIVPVVDLRIRFGLGTVEYTPFTVLIIVDLGVRIVGIVVDSVSDVITLGAQSIHPAPDFVSTIGARYMLGLGTVGERMLIVVDIGRLMLSREMALVDEVAA